MTLERPAAFSIFQIDNLDVWSSAEQPEQRFVSHEKELVAATIGCSDNILCSYG